ncbi:MAG: heavy metal-binding domain-containing protein [Rhodobacteraceae bacterium]|nr:heavy metal-binding domain-containing protein [Paracoccaceae bacterium]
MLVTTESQIDLKVEDRLGIVSAEVVVGMNIFKDFLTGVRNVVGGRTGNVQNALRDIRRQAIEELKDEAAELGADAVVAVDLSYNEIGATGSTMLMLVASGTAVKLRAE